jgi:hypothetical protein
MAIRSSPMSKLIASVVLAAAACDHKTKIAALTTCRAIVSFAPVAATISVGDSIVFVMTVEAGCSAPLVRNETPMVIRVDPISIGRFSVVGLSQGIGRVRMEAAVDTLVARELLVTVDKRGVAAMSVESSAERRAVVKSDR